MSVSTNHGRLTFQKSLFSKNARVLVSWIAAVSIVAIALGFSTSTVTIGWLWSIVTTCAIAVPSASTV